MPIRQILTRALERHLPALSLVVIILVLLLAAPASPSQRYELGDLGPDHQESAVSTPEVDPALPVLSLGVARAASPDDPVRLQASGLGIDLAVYAGETGARPRCQIAEFASALGRPRLGRSWTFIYAHGRPGMFGALVGANDARLRGTSYRLWTADGRRWEYRLARVIRHSSDVGDLSGLPPEVLILQTCETANGKGPKIYLVLSLVGTPRADPSGAAQELPLPVNCA